MTRRTALGILLVILGGLAWTSGQQPVSGSHLENPIYKWSDLQPGGDKHLNYDVCTAYSPSEANWRTAVENWDSYLTTLMDFDEVGCHAMGTQTTLQWESVGGNECIDPTFIACWFPMVYTPQPGYRQVTYAIIWFDRSQYPALSTAFQVQAAAHEWGHNLSLEHHRDDNACTLPGVMANIGGSSPCFQAPAGSELYSVECVVYYTCGWTGPLSDGYVAWPSNDPTPKGISQDRPVQADHTYMVKVQSNDVWLQWWNGSVWSGWVNWSVGTTTPFSLTAAVSNHYSQVHVAAPYNGDMWYRGPDGAWSNLGKPTSQGFQFQVAVTNTDTTVQIVGIVGGDAYFKKKENNVWSGWQPLGGSHTLGTGIAISTSKNGQHHVVSITPGSAHVWMTWWDGLSGNWQGWLDLGCCLDGGVAVDNSFADLGNTSSTQTGVHTASLSSANVQVRCWESYCSSYWEGIGGAFQAPLSIANYGDIHAEAISSNTLYHRRRGP